MKISITFYVQKQACSGNIDLHDEERLSDLLNSRFDNQPEVNDGFLRIRDFIMALPDNTKERLAEVSIKKSAIELVALQDGNLARGIGCSSVSKNYPFIEKSPVPVRLHLPEYSIMGNIYCRHNQSAYELLEEPLMFIPITQAKIFTPDMSSWWKAPFSAVNRNQITMFSEMGNVS